MLCIVNARKLRIQKAKGSAFRYKLKGRDFFCVPGLTDSEDLFLRRKIDEKETRILEKWLRRGDVMVDVGANVGLYAVVAAQKVGDEGSVLAIEASPSLAGKLKLGKEILKTKCLHVECIAAGDRNGEATFVLSKPGTHTSEQSLLSDRIKMRASSRLVKVPLRRLGELTQSYAFLSKPDLIKMDIEGAEEMAMRGCPPRWFEGNGPLWIVEINPKALEGFRATPRKILQRFTNGTHHLWLIPKYSNDPEQEDLPRRVSDQEICLDAKFYNLIAVPKNSSRKTETRKIIKILESKSKKGCSAGVQKY
jgi:FkbM family methyltransferase